MTWNVHGSARPDLPRLAEIIRDQRPDVLAVQEIQRSQARTLAGSLGWQHMWTRKHHPYSPAVPWLSEGLAILSPHALADPAHRTLTPGVSTWTFRHRVVQAATVRRDEASLRLYCTHLASHRQPDDRIAQAQRIVSMICDERPSVAVVAGDLNAPGEIEVIRPFHEVGLRDPGGGPTHPSGAPRARLDYIVVPETARVLDRHEPDGGDDWRQLSDHLPVLIEIVLP